MAAVPNKNLLSTICGWDGTRMRRMDPVPARG